MKLRDLGAALTVAALLCLSAPALAQAPASEDEPSDAGDEFAIPDTSGMLPLAPASMGVGDGGAFMEALGLDAGPDDGKAKPLPPIREAEPRVPPPPLPQVVPGDSIVVDQILTTDITDPEIVARADSLNRLVRMMAIEEQLVRAELAGTRPRIGLLTRQDYLDTRLDLLRTMEEGIRDHLKTRLAHLDSASRDLLEVVESERGREIATLEEYVERYPDRPEVVDAKFILAQLYSDEEEAELGRATRRWAAELNRYFLKLVPVMPNSPQPRPSAATQLYRDIVHAESNRSLIPFSLYKLGTYHVTLAGGFRKSKKSESRLGRKEESRRLAALEGIHADSAKGYFARIITEFPEDTVNVPAALSVLGNHYSVLGQRDTAAVYLNALVKTHWYYPRYRDALRALAEISYWNAHLETKDEKKKNGQFSDALAYLAWATRELDAFDAEQIPGISPQPHSSMGVYSKDLAVEFMTKIITRSDQYVAGGFRPPPPPVETAVGLVDAVSNAPFGADLLRQVGDAMNDRYGTSDEAPDLVAALTAYDSLLSRYPKYVDGPQIQQQIIDNSTFLAQDDAARLAIFLTKKIDYFVRFNRDGEWAKSAQVGPAQLRAADDSAAAYLELAVTQLYAMARNSGDREGTRNALEYFVTYFRTYPERPQAYELNWRVATELRDLGDHERAYNEFMRITKAPLEDHREDAAIEAIAVAQQLLENEQAAQQGGTPEGEPPTTDE